MSELRKGGGFLVEPTVRVDGHRDLDVAVPDDLADDVRRDSKSEQKRDGCVSKIVKAQRHAGLGASRAPVLAQAVGRRRRSPASTHSSSWRFRCSRSAVTTTCGSGITLRDARVFGGCRRGRPSTQARVWRTQNRPLRGRSRPRSARAAPRGASRARLPGSSTGPAMKRPQRGRLTSRLHSPC